MILFLGGGGGGLIVYLIIIIIIIIILCIHIHGLLYLHLYTYKTINTFNKIF